MSENKFNKRVIAGVVVTHDTEGKKTLVKFPSINMFGKLIPGKKLEDGLSLTKGQQLVVFGDLGYEEYTTKEGKKRQNLVVFVDEVKEPEEGKEPSVWVFLSLTTAKEGYYAYTQTGKPWIGTRVFMPQGKDRDGNWKPSLFIDAKYFGKDDEDKLPECLSNKGVRFDAKGFLELESFKTKDGKDASKVTLKILSGEVRESTEAEEAAEGMEGEPA